MSTLKFDKLNSIVLFAGSNRVADEVLAFLTEQNRNAILYVYREYEWVDLNEDIIRGLQPDLMITCYWPYLLKKEMIDVPKYGTINFHPAYLPYNRGWYPSVWPFIDVSPAGVTLHLIDEGADTGPIVAQDKIEIEEIDNGGSLYKKCQDRMISLFKETWLKLNTIGIELKVQDHSKATYHSKADANALDEVLDPHQYYVFDLLRAKTFGDKCFAYYVKDGVKYRMHLTITKDNG